VSDRCAAAPGTDSAIPTRLMTEPSLAAMSVIRTTRHDRAVHEAIVRVSGAPLSPAQRVAGDRVYGAAPSHVSLSAMVSGRCVGVLSAEVHPSPRFSGSTIVIARRISASTEPSVLLALLAQLDQLATDELGARRVVISLVGSTQAELDRAASLMPSLGFEPSARPKVPAHTILLDLRDGEEALLRNARPSLRRSLREVVRLPIRCDSIRSVLLVDRLKQIKQASYARHGSVPPPLPFAGFVETASAHPDAFSLIGLYRDDVIGADSLIAFEFTSFDGRLATSEHAGMVSTRVDGRSVPGGYATLWESIRWAIRRGAVAFDLGGISMPGDSTYEATRTIAQFKRNFGGEIVTGLEREFVKRPNTFTARLMNALASVAGRLR